MRFLMTEIPFLALENKSPATHRDRDRRGMAPGSPGGRQEAGNSGLR